MNMDFQGTLNGTVHRFYLSLILFDLWNQNSVWKVANKFLLPRGLVHNFLISASAFSSSVVRFCEVCIKVYFYSFLRNNLIINNTLHFGEGGLSYLIQTVS